MDFKFRADDGRSSAFISTSSSDSYFTKQALRAGYLPNDIRGNDFQREAFHVREGIQRALEKKRIREEIVAAEISNKRLLEAEVRRELLMERELALRMTAESFPSASSSFMRSEPRLPLIRHADGIRFPEPEMLPFQRPPEDIHKTSEIKLRLPAVSKRPVVFLTKPTNANFAGTKRKAVSGGNELLGIGSKMKTQKGLNCALCQVSATSEQALNDHLEGKKHKAKAAALKESRTKKNTGSSIPLPKKTNKSLHSYDPRLEKKEKGKKQKIKPGDLYLQKRQKNQIIKKKKGSFWCEMCHIRANSEKMLADHMGGKKHLAELQKLKEDGKIREDGKKENEGSNENVDEEVDGKENFDGEENEDIMMETEVVETAESEATEVIETAESEGQETGEPEEEDPEEEEAI